MPDEGAVPLLYPIHFNGQNIHWPIPDGKKPNAIINNEKTFRWLYANGYYTVVRRFSSKEEKRRIVARVIDPDAFPGFEWIGIENHLNVFHWGKQPINQLLARGLAIFLNSTVVDNHFRRFSGHTQVNAADLRFMKYPSRESLIELGRWAKHQEKITQEAIDEHVEKAVL
jgi:adenine-specific DNA-methyltransferase